MKLSPHARAIRDVEDEELWSFFYGMSPWQVSLSGSYLGVTLSVSGSSLKYDWIVFTIFD